MANRNILDCFRAVFVVVTDSIWLCYVSEIVQKD